MGIQTLRPNTATWGLTSGTVVPSGTLSGVTSDNSDSTYARASTDAQLFIGFDTFTLPAGARTLGATLRFRGQCETFGTSIAFYVTDNNGGYQEGTFTLLSTLQDYYCYPSLSKAMTQAEIDALNVRVGHTYGSYTDFWRLMEAYLDVWYATAPTTTITAPTANQVITTTTTPTFQWTHTPGDYGGSQTAYRIIVAEKVIASAGGYDPLTGTKTWDSGEVAGSASSAVCGVSLNNSTVYRAFIKTAQTVSDALMWPTSWATVDFTISVTPPATPTLTATLQAGSGRVQLVMTTSTAASALAYWEVDASTDGGATWTRRVRGDMSTGPGYISPNGASSVTRHDYEIEVGKATVYRARVTSTTLGSPIASSWSTTTGSVTWSPTGLWIKCPSAPAYNLSGLRLQAQRNFKRDGRSTALYPIGRSNALVVSDARGGREGALGVLTTSAGERASLTTLLERQEPLLVQGPSSWELDHYASLLDTMTERPTKLPAQADRYETLNYVQTDRPSTYIPVASWPA